MRNESVKYKNKLNDGEDKILAQWIIQNAEKGWE